MDDVAFALACAILGAPPEEVAKAFPDGKYELPAIERRDERRLETPAVIGRDGKKTEPGRTAAALFYWNGPKGRLVLGNDITKPELAHEMRHVLQYRAGRHRGKAITPDWYREMEREAYETQDKARYECLATFGGWKKDKLSPLARQIMENSAK